MLVGTFFRIGLFTFGGGYAMLPMLYKEVVDRHRWATEEELLDYFAIGQSTPGIIAINTATFIGFRQKGISGAIAATIGMVIPSFVIITLIAALFSQISGNIYFQKAFQGIRITVVALIIQAVYRIGKKGVKGVFGILLAALAFGVTVFLNVSPIFVIAGAIVLGIFFRGPGKEEK